MIEKINELKNKVNSLEVKTLCENAISIVSSAIYNAITPEAKLEIEKVAMNNLFEGLTKHKNVIGVSEWLSNETRLYALKNLGVRDAINSLNESKELKVVLEQYKESLNNGIHECRLYESFITALSPFGYFPTVGNAVQAIKDRVNKYKNDVDILKILETMKETRSNYLVPLIETVVNNYLSNKTQQNKHILHETLIKFTYDPFVRDIVNLVSLDATELQLEYANAQCDIEKVYSPVLYIGENEAVFAVNKQYYVKKGNNISRLPEIEVLKLDEEFKTLCETLSNPNIIVEKNGVTVYFGNDKAFINDKEVIVNEQKMTKEQFVNAASISEWAGNRGFFQLVEFLNSNYNEIAEIDFVKRVYLKENENFSADVFKLRDNVFITTHNPELNKSTFYRNINPIQAKNIMMEHLRFDVTSLYKGILPDEQKIIEEINETKQEYLNYMSELESKINQFRNNEYGENINEQVIEVLEEELHDVKGELKDYLNNVEKYLRPEAVNEDISIDINVDGKKYTVPIPKDQTSNDEKGEEGTEVGKENIEDKPASAVTFGDENTELLGDTPTIPEDKIDMGSDSAEEEAETAEKEAEEREEEEKDKEEESDDDIKIEDEVDSDEEDKEELKKDDEEEEDEDKKKDKKKLQKLESAEWSTGLSKTKFVGEASKKSHKKKRVFLKKKVSESQSVKKKTKLNENLEEYGLYNFYKIDIDGALFYIVVNPDGSNKVFNKEGNNVNIPYETLEQYSNNISKCSESDIPEKAKEILIKSKDFADELNSNKDEILANFGDEKQAQKEKTYANMSKYELNNLLDQALDNKDYEKAKEISQYIKESLKPKSINEILASPIAFYGLVALKAQEMLDNGIDVETIASFICNKIGDNCNYEKILSDLLNEEDPNSIIMKYASANESLEETNETNKQTPLSKDELNNLTVGLSLDQIEQLESDDLFNIKYKLPDGKIINVDPNGTAFLLNENKKISKSNILNESSQIGDDVIFNKQRGSIIGQIGNDWIVQVQGSTHFANDNEVKPIRQRVESIRPPFKFSKETQKLLFEQYVKCGIFMDNVPVKTSNCYVRYSDWNEAKDQDPINVIVEGQLSILNKNKVKIFEDMNNFANLDNYVEGVEIDEESENAISNVRINIIDYTESIGDSDPVRIIRNGNGQEPIVDTLPKSKLRTLAV